MGHLEIPNTWQRESHERCVVDHLLQCLDRKSTRLNSSHLVISYAVFCLKKKKTCILTLTPHPMLSILFNLTMLDPISIASLLESQRVETKNKACLRC